MAPHAMRGAYHALPLNFPLRHPGSFDIITVKDATGAVFATRRQNVFCIGKGTKPWVTLPKGKGIKVSIVEERTARKIKI